ncbi:MAG: hypothetical protein NTY03_00775 [Candidatus Bathyarchaeota archaeon]|nr:hypothetical protein [Candidatus Bathyarchaeota archaeon]
MRGVVVRGSKGAYVWDFGNQEYGHTRLQGTLALERQSDAYGYGIIIDTTRFFNSAYAYGAAKKNWAVYIGGAKPSNCASTGDSNDAFLRIKGSNYAVNDGSFVWRGVNVEIRNEKGGHCGVMDNNISAANRSGGTSHSTVGLTVSSENMGVCADVFGGLHVNLSNEGAAATKSYGIRVVYNNLSLATPIGSILEASNGTINTGFTRAFDLSDCDLVANGNDVTIMTFKDAAGAAKKLTYTIGDVVLDVGAG